MCGKAKWDRIPFSRIRHRHHADLPARVATNETGTKHIEHMFGQMICEIIYIFESPSKIWCDLRCHKVSVCAFVDQDNQHQAREEKMSWHWQNLIMRGPHHGQGDTGTLESPKGVLCPLSWIQQSIQVRILVPFTYTRKKNKGKTGKKPKFGHIPKVFFYDNLHKYFVLKVSLLLRGGLRGDWENFSNWLTWEESFFPVNYWETAKKTAITDAKKTV